ncbi:MAG: DUF4835 family protein [Cyclobacteriaceae bacterium]|nr:DUF4835 family protein [Cyclobacteriaceae bacterium]MCH8515518.1 DUF4835 family protein [Cyclobacteriaceae bacterium]
MQLSKVYILSGLAFLLCFVPQKICWGQELFAEVIVNDMAVRTQDKRVFRDMETAFSRFLNERKWGDDEFAPQERIQCAFNITISEMPSIGQFRADVQIIASRPVYNSSYYTPTFNFADRNFNFSYVEAQPIEFNENSWMSNLASMLAYYAYVILAIDFDTFEEFGGEPYVRKAFNIVNLAQSENAQGWQQMESNRNRYWLIENMLNDQLQAVRKANYIYHREVLDQFAENPEKAQERALVVIEELSKANRIRPNSILVITFLDAKGREIANMFSEGDPSLRRKAHELLVKIDPSKSDRYDKMLP